MEIAGRTLLEITLSRLRAFGVREVIVNVHHFADMVVDYLKQHDHFGMRIEVSREEVLLDTGGGLKKAAWFFLEDSSGLDEPFLLHNVDVISTIDLRRMVQFHREQSGPRHPGGAGPRDFSIPALRRAPSALRPAFRARSGRRNWSDLPRRSQALAFSGIHVISPRLLTMMTEEGVFSIITSYLRLAALGEKIVAFRADEYYWRDLGKPENVAQAAQDLKHKVLL